ncbi:VPS13 [Candida metapsilosis]|uniref:Vacuolar protein sorting-associated protein n=1 Tax=Candida metapsilosis TaxID=273372 RepID=A0A8H8DCC0_9ASCO|nr:VPS13 [Candida metapsilosis]
MFESLVANLINRFLGSYIENFDPKQLNIGIWSGDVKLRNLRLKKESLDKFKLPIDVKFGHLGELTLQIPWSNLKSKPVRIIIEDLYLLASPVILQDYDEEEDEKRQQALKESKLKDLEAILEAKGEELGRDLADETFAESLVKKIVDNLQVTIKKIHVRYEDQSVLTEKPYTLGLSLDELSAVSTDENWKPSFIAITQAFTRKLLTLKSFYCYMETKDPQLYSDLDKEGQLTEFKAQGSIHEYLMKPVSGNGKLTIHKLGATEEHPHLDTELFFEEFGLELNEQQYEDILWTASKFRWYSKTSKFRKFRPKVSPSEDPKAWFKYAGECVLNEIHEKNYKWTWENFAKRRDERKAYIKLWKLKLENNLGEDKEKLHNLEQALSFDDIKLYRSLARNELRKEGSKVKLYDTESTDKNQQQKKGWFSGWWGGGNAPTQEEEQSKTIDADGEHIDLSLTEDQRKTLYDTIDYDEEAEISTIDLPDDCVKIRVSASLNKGGLVVRRNDLTALADVAFEGCKAHFFQRPNSFLAGFQVLEFKVEDGTGSSVYNHIVSVKQAGSNENGPSTPFFQIQYEQNPLDGSADSKLLGSLKSMTIFYNSKFIEELIRFFTPPKIHLDTVGAIMNAAESTVEGLTSQTRLGLEYALEEHKTINVNMDLQTPLLIMPLDPSSYKSPVAILDAGHINIVSELVEKSKIKEYKDKEKYSEEDWKNLNELLYDQFKFSLEDAQFFVGHTIKSTMEQLYSHDKPRPALMLNNFNVNFTLGLSILPDAQNLARIRLGGNVPKLQLAMNDFQYKTILSILDAAIPDTNFDTPDESSVFEAYGNDYNGNEIDIDDDSLDEKEEKKDKSVQKPSNSEQHMIELKFSVDFIKLDLLRCVDGHTLEAEPLIEIVGNALELDLYKTETDLHLNLGLLDFNILDHIEKSGKEEFQKLLTSNTDSKSKNKLMDVEYNRRLRIVDFNNKKIEVFDQDIDLHLGTVKFVITRKSLLSILTFCLNTFTDPNQEPTPADELNHNNPEDVDAAPQKINMKLGLDNVIMVLNEDGLKLATFSLNAAHIKLLLLPETMDVSGSLGALSLLDELVHNNDNSPRYLIQMDENDLAKFSYKTFDLHDQKPSELKFNVSAISVNFIESSFGRIVRYGNQFMQMKAIYDRTREAAINEAAQLPNKLKFDILVQGPKITFPIGESGSDKVVANLGEIYAHNEYKDILNVISVGIRNVQLLSNFQFDKVKQDLKVIDDLDIAFDVNWSEDYIKGTPTFEITGKMPELDVHLTELQAKSLTSISNSVAAAFSVDDESSGMEEIEEEAAFANEVLKHNTRAIHGESAISDAKVSQEPESVENVPSDHTMAQITFELPRISLSLYNNTENMSDIKQAQLSSFSLNEVKVGFNSKQDSSFKANLAIESFVVEDTRQHTDSKFPVIIPAADDVENQFSLQVTSDVVGESKTMAMILTVEKPKAILALDYLFDLQAFFDTAMPSDEKAPVDKDQPRKSVASITEVTPPTESSSPTQFGFSINIVKPSVFLLADNSKADTEAIAFKVEQISISKQNIISLATSKVGLYLTRMDDPKNSKYRIIDDFSISFAYDDRRSSPGKFLDNIQASIDPLVIRVSVRDIRLGLGIVQRVNDLYAKHQDTLGKGSNDAKSISESDDDYDSSSIATSQQLVKVESEQTVGNEIVKGEELTASFGGLRFVLIGDVSDLPVLDMNVNPFEVRAVNWSTDLSAEIHLETFVNIFNYSKSAWEPLIESWPVAVYASKTQGPDSKLFLECVSRQVAQMTVTSRSVALLSQVQYLLSSDEKLKPRGEDYPFLIVNDTGLDLTVWTNGNKAETETKIKYGESKPWAFEDWRKIRENLDVNTANTLDVAFENDEYEDIEHISAAREGEDLHVLYPAVGDVHNRLSVSIKLREDNVKIITLRSTFVIENDAEVPVIVETFDDEERTEIKIESKNTLSVPINLAYNGRLRVKPDLHTPYDWSEGEIYWKDAMKSELSLRCQAATRGDTSVFYFQAKAVFDRHEPLAQVYPHMKFVISAPLEIENLLPYDFDYRLYDKNSRREWTGSVKKGVKSYVHVVSLKNLLLLSIQPRNCNYSKSEFAVINRGLRSDFERENTLKLKGDNMLRLNIFYPRKQADSTSLKAVIYSPYVILNRSNLNIIANERDNQFISSAKTVDSEQIYPTMFSFFKLDERKNRATIKTDETVWSRPLSFDAIGQASELRLQLLGKQKEINLGVTISEGEGIYNLTKTITITPRYVVINRLQENVSLAEEGSIKEINAIPDALLPLYGLRCVEKKNLIMKLGQTSRWSQPFCIDNVGQLYIKVQKSNVGQVLVKVTMLLEDATMFIHIEDANNQWPYSIKNYTDEEFYIYQNNPNINADGEIVKRDTVYKPIYYRVPPKSVMPYAYDYPNGIVKEIIVRAHGRERAVNLAEIGNLRPFRLPSTDSQSQQIVDLNVVADGPTQCLVITDYDPSQSMYKIKNETQSSSSLPSNQDHFVEADVEDNYHTKIVTNFDGLGISLINTREQELCYVTLRGIEFRYNESNLYQNFSAKLKWVQIDNQLYGGIFPIILYPSVIPKTGKELNEHPALSASVCRVKDDSHGVVFVKYATTLMQELNFEIDEDFLFAMLDFIKFPGASWNKEQVNRLCDENLDIPEPSKLSNSSDIYFEALHLQPIQANISFVRTDRLNAEDKTSSQNTVMFFLNILTMAIGNINDAPIKLNALFIENIRAPTPILVESIKTHYSQAFFYQLYNIVGSADFLGNPVGLFNLLSSGVMDIFYEPYQGYVLTDSPQELGIGLAKGGLSFMKKSVFGFSDSIAKVTGSIAKGLTVATMDSKFQERRRLQTRRNRANHAVYGFTTGANSFIEALSSGIGGIAAAPMEGADEEGAAGFFKGVGKGIIGLPTKTAIGFFDFASNVSEGIRNTTTVLDGEKLDRIRLPRYINPEEVIKPYNEREAQGQFWMHSIDDGVYWNHTYLAHLLLPGDEMAILVTLKDIILFDIKTLQSKWIVRFDQVKSISVESTGLTIELKNRKGPFIPIPDRKNRTYLYQKIGVAVKEYNKFCRVTL